MATMVGTASLRNAVFEQLCDPILVVDLQGNLLDLNTAATRVLALDPLYSLQQPLSELLRHIPEISACFLASAPSGTSLSLPGGDSGRRFYVCSATALQGPDGGHAGTLLHLREVTKVAEVICDVTDSPDMHVTVNPVSSTIFYCNRTIATVLGYPMADLIGKPIRFLFKAACYARLEQSGFAAVGENGTAADADVVLQRRDGTFVDASMTSTVVRDTRGHPTMVRTTFRDISERKRLEKALRAALAKHAALFDSTAIGVTVTDATGKILESNRAAARILGVPQQEFERRSFDSPEWLIIRPDGTPMPPMEYASVRALSENRLVENVKMGVVKGPGCVAWISVNAAPIPLEGYGVVITYTEISEGVSG